MRVKCARFNGIIAFIAIGTENEGKMRKVLQMAIFQAFWSKIEKLILKFIKIIIIGTENEGKMCKVPINNNINVDKIGYLI